MIRTMHQLSATTTFEDLQLTATSITAVVGNLLQVSMLAKCVCRCCIDHSVHWARHRLCVHNKIDASKLFTIHNVNKSIGQKMSSAINRLPPPSKNPRPSVNTYLAWRDICSVSGWIWM